MPQLISLHRERVDGAANPDAETLDTLRPGETALETVAAATPAAAKLSEPSIGRSALGRSLVPALALHIGVLGLLAWRMTTIEPAIAHVEPTISLVALPPAETSAAAAATMAEMQPVMPVAVALAETAVPPTISSAPPQDASPSVTPEPTPEPTPTPEPMAALVPPGLDIEAAPIVSRPRHERVPHEQAHRVTTIKTSLHPVIQLAVPANPISATPTGTPIAAGINVGSAPPRPITRDGVAEASFEQRIRDAVQDAVRYPAAARMMGITGRARLELVYRAGAVSTVTLAQSAGGAMLDNAAVVAAHAARYPAAPAEIGDRTLRFLIWVEFGAS